MQAPFTAQLRRPAKCPDGESPWAFVILPKAESDKLPRRGRTTVEGSINGQYFQATLEPDGQLSHWLKLDQDFLVKLDARAGDYVTLEITPLAIEPEPEIPPDLKTALAADLKALSTWQATTTIARVDWIHWITSAKQAKTRMQRIANARDMLAKGKRRVCCFDPSGYYSKALSAPAAASEDNE